MSQIKYFCTNNKCNNAYYNLKSLNDHIKLKHVRKLLICPVCEKIIKSRYLRHIKTHSNELFECYICSKKFNRNDNLEKHLKSHGKIKSE